MAFGSQKATWVRLSGHGQVAPAPLPEELARFLREMGPPGEVANPLRPLPEPLSGLQTGNMIYEASPGPAAGRLLRTETFQTTLEEANLVGNVYFANYFAWQGRVRDLFLHAIAPEYLRGVGERGEMIGLRTRVDYLREAMPFDRVQVDMRLRSLSGCGAVLGFEYYRLLPDGKRQKLSVGVQDVAWVERAPEGSPVATRFPEEIRRAFEAAPVQGPRQAVIRNRPALLSAL